MRSTKARGPHALAFVGLVGLVALVAPSACTAGIAPATGDGGSLLGDASGGGDDGAITSDSGVIPRPDAIAPVMPVSGTYYTACLTKLAAGRVDRALHFYSAVTFTSSGAGGRLSIELTPLKITAPATAPSTVSKTQAVGSPISIVSATVSATGLYKAPAGTVTIPGEANNISGRPITIETAAFNGRFGAGTFCSQLSGEVTSPTFITLVGDENTCIYFPVKDGDVPPKLKTDGSDFTSGCPLD